MRLPVTLILGPTLLVAACGGQANTRDSNSNTSDEPASGGTVGSGGTGASGGTGGTDIEDPAYDEVPANSRIACDNPEKELLSDGAWTTLLHCSDVLTLRGGPETCGDHRATASDLPMRGPQDECAAHLDCLGEHGYCHTTSDGSFRGPNKCSEGCVDDDDCSTNQVCICGEVIGTCVDSGCSSNSDCPTGELCIASRVAPCAPRTFACSSPEDDCTTDDDCSDGGRCVLEEGHRACGFACIPI